MSPRHEIAVLICMRAGGCAAASDAIREEVMSVRRSGKPVVVSMGNMATSGGYLISGAFRIRTQILRFFDITFFVVLRKLKTISNHGSVIWSHRPSSESSCSSVVSAMLHMSMRNEMLQSVHGRVVLAQGLPHKHEIHSEGCCKSGTNIVKMVVMLSCSGC